MTKNKFLAVWLMLLTPVLIGAQVVGPVVNRPIQGGGGGLSTLTIGSTTITGGATTQILYNNGGVISSSAGLTFASGVLTVDSSAIIPTISGSISADGDITINGTTSATKTTSYVILQETGGFVGIGTATPATRLHVVGDGLTGPLRVTNTNVSGYSSVNIHDSSGSEVVTFGYGNASSALPVFVGKAFFYTAGKDFVISSDASTSIFSVPANGSTTIGGTGITGTTVAATINGGTSTGNILNVQDNGTNVFSVTDGAAPVVFKSTGMDFALNGTVTLGNSLVGTTFLSATNGNVVTIKPGGTNGSVKIGGAEALSVTNAPYQQLSVDVSQVGFASNGFGQRFALLAPSSTTNSQPLAYIDAVWSDITHASRTSYMAFHTTIGGTTAERVRIGSSGGLQIASGTKPSCDSTTRGTQFYVAGGAGVADTYEVCKKDAGDSYAWTSVY